MARARADGLIGVEAEPVASHSLSTLSRWAAATLLASESPLLVPLKTLTMACRVMRSSPASQAMRSVGTASALANPNACASLSA